MDALKLYRKEMKQCYLDSVVDDYDYLMEQTEMLYNEKNYCHCLTDKQMEILINFYTDVKRGYTMENSEEIDLEMIMSNPMIRDSQGRIFFDLSYEIAPGGLVIIKEYIVRKSELNLEEIVKLNLIKNAPNIATKMKLLEPKIYNSARDFYLSLES